MIVKAYFRGHEIVHQGGEVWHYADTGTRAGFGHEVRPCKKCGAQFEGSNEDKPDPCLGKLPGIENACCGHGVKSEAYVCFENGGTLRGFEVEKRK